MQWGSWDSKKLGEFFVKQSIFTNRLLLVESLDGGYTGPAQAEWKPLLCDLGLAFSPLRTGACHLHTKGRETGIPWSICCRLGVLAPSKTFVQ